MALVRNVSTGPRGAYLAGAYVEAGVGETIEADDFAPEWFEPVKSDPLDHDGDGRKGGAKKAKPAETE